MELVYFLICVAASAIFAVTTDVPLDKMLAGLSFLFMSLQASEKIEQQEEINGDVEVVPYVDRYKKEFRCMKETDHVPENLEKSFVMEFTPVGNVMMLYNKERETFFYYSDNEVPFRFLEVVARKYALMFQCKSLVIDAEIEMEKLEQKKKDDMEKAEEEKVELEKKPKVETPPKKKDVFAKFKSYNAASSGPGPGTTKNVEAKTANLGENVVDTNRYMHQGRFSVFNWSQPPKKNNTDDRSELTFADFKKMQLDNKNLV